MSESKSTTVTIYQNILRPSLYSQCKYFPSDSQYSQILAQKCGTVSSLFKTLDRFLREPDAGQMGLSMITYEHGQSFLDLPTDCKVLD